MITTHKVEAIAHSSEISLPLVLRVYILHLFFALKGKLAKIISALLLYKY